jgi:hypothetical protein
VSKGAGRSKRAPAECVYCGSAAGTRDHIPPACLFPRPRPSNLITVPSCRECNTSASQQDEYFLVALALHGRALAHPAMRTLWPTISRALSKPQKQGFAWGVANRTVRKAIQQPSGEEIKGMQHEVDEHRVGPVIDRVTMGLCYHHFQQRLPDSHRVVAVMEYRMDIPRANDLAELARKHPLHDIGGRVFQYHYFRPNQQKDPSMSVWLMKFYDDVPFLSVTLPIGSVGGRLWPLRRPSQPS